MTELTIDDATAAIVQLAAYLERDGLVELDAWGHSNLTEKGGAYLERHGVSLDAADESQVYLLHERLMAIYVRDPHGLLLREKRRLDREVHEANAKVREAELPLRAVEREERRRG